MTPRLEDAEKVACVAIGRNEGHRLGRCLDSLFGFPVVYVDSGSTDGSVDRARRAGVQVVELDPSRPFTAARARNEGLERALELQPAVDYVHFVDADCEIQPDWISTAIAFLDHHPDVAVACGRRRELDAHSTVFSRLLDMEWDRPPGDIESCGGDALVRVGPFRQVGGFNGSLIAGEEPDLCLRLRQAGFRIVRLPHEMTLHDGDIRTWWQWWRRTARAGHAYSEGVFLHRLSSDVRCIREVASFVFWAGALPLAIAAAAALAAPMALVLLPLVYGLFWGKIYRSRRRASYDRRSSRLYATSIVVGKFAELQGGLQFAWNRLLHGRTNELIEYKRESIP